MLFQHFHPKILWKLWCHNYHYNPERWNIFHYFPLKNSAQRYTMLLIQDEIHIYVVRENKKKPP
jgi:hypothetical protein